MDIWTIHDRISNFDRNGVQWKEFITLLKFFSERLSYKLDWVVF